MNACLRFAPMIGSREGELPGEEARALAGHLAECPRCRAMAADAAATEGLLRDALLAKANARDFGPFVDQVMARVERHPVVADLAPVRPVSGAARRGAVGRAGRASPSLPRPRASGGEGRGEGVLALLFARWRLTAAAVAAVLAVAAAFMYFERSAPEEAEQIASLEMDIEGGNTVLQTSDGPVVLLAPDDSGS